MDAWSAFSQRGSQSCERRYGGHHRGGVRTAGLRHGALGDATAVRDLVLAFGLVMVVIAAGALIALVVLNGQLANLR